MLGIFRSRNRGSNRKNASRHNTIPVSAVESVHEAETKQMHTFPDDPAALFAIHISKYLGSTVTVFVPGGGISGLGFTGILIFASSSYIKILTRPGPAPACSLGSSCFYSFNRLPFPGMQASCSRVLPVISLGSVACIPVSKIICFVHNAL